MNYDNYPANWREISRRIRNEANNRCELCDVPDLSDRSASRVVLTVHHIGVKYPDGRPGNANDKQDVRDENLISLCQACHLAADRELRLGAPFGLHTYFKRCEGAALMRTHRRISLSSGGRILYLPQAEIDLVLQYDHHDRKIVARAYHRDIPEETGRGLFGGSIDLLALLRGTSVRPAHLRTIAEVIEREP